RVGGAARDDDQARAPRPAGDARGGGARRPLPVPPRRLLRDRHAALALGRLGPLTMRLRARAVLRVVGAACVLVTASRAAAESASGTFSIVAYDSTTGELGVAVESRAFDVGARVPWARARVGALATQAATSASFGPRALALLASGADAQQ